MADIDIAVVSGAPVFLGIIETTIGVTTTSGDATTLVVSSGDIVNIDIVSGSTTTVNVNTPGVQGPMGPSGPFYGVPFFVQSGAPIPAQYSGYTTYAWWQTSSGNSTLWIEDGL